MHESWREVRSTGVRKIWGQSVQHQVQALSMSCSGGRERKACECNYCTWHWRSSYPSGVSSMNGII